MSTATRPQTDPDRRVDPDTGEILDTRTIRPFLAFLQEHRDGQLHEQLSEALHQVVTAVRGVGKNGSVTLVVEIKPAGRSHDQVFVVGSVKTRLPEAEPARKSRSGQTRYESPPEVLRLNAADAPSAHGRRPGPGEFYAILTVPLDNGRRLVLELGAETRRRIGLSGECRCDQPCCAPPGAQLEGASPLS